MYSSEMKQNSCIKLFSIVGFCHNRVILRCLKQKKSYASALGFCCCLACSKIFHDFRGKFL